MWYNLVKIAHIEGESRQNSKQTDSSSFEFLIVPVSITKSPKESLHEKHDFYPLFKMAAAQNRENFWMDVSLKPLHLGIWDLHLNICFKGQQIRWTYLGTRNIDQDWFDQRWPPFCLCKVAISSGIWYTYNHVAKKFVFIFVRQHKHCFDLEWWITSNCHFYDYDVSYDVTVLIRTIPCISMFTWGVPEEHVKLW